MRKFSKDHRDRSMTVTVSYKGVPTYRGLAFALAHIEKKGGPIDLFSADRRDWVIKEHNRLFGTNLHGQQWLVNAHAASPRTYNPANPVSRTSHCLRSDGNPAYRVGGRQIPAGSPLPWYMLGHDLADKGEFESVDEFLAVARKLGYQFMQPYPVGGERHHVVCVASPIATLERWNQISKERK